MNKIAVFLLTLCLVGCSGGGSSSSEGSPVGLLEQTISFQQVTPVKVFAGDEFVNPLSQLGQGVVNYSSSDENVAVVNANGNVKVVAVGVATITAAVGEDEIYKSGEASFSLSAVEREFRFYAWVGDQNSDLLVPSSQESLPLYLSQDSDCDTENYSVCESSALIELSNDTYFETVSALSSQHRAYAKLVHGESEAIATFSPYVVTPRATSGVVEFNGKLWMIGGNHAEWYDDTAAVLYSDNGIDWVKATEGEPFWGRHQHSLVEFKGKLYLISGHIGPTDNNDVWSSEDGIHWQEVEQISEFTRRGDQQVLVHADKLWLIGGSNDTTGSAQVWSSTDAQTWVLEAEDAGFGARLAHQIVKKDDTFWLMGGETNHTSLNDVWKSADLINWQKVVDNAAWPARTNHEVVVYQDKLLLVGGNKRENVELSVFSDVWQSGDGENWELLTDTAEFGSVTYHDLVVYKDAVYLMSGAWGENAIPSSDVWKTTNGSDWIALSSHTDIGARSGHEIVEFNNKLLLIGGATGIEDNSKPEYFNDVWQSFDGLKWDKLVENTEFTARADFELVSFNNELLIYGGISKDDQGDLVIISDVWKSSDGSSWQQLDGQSLFTVCDGMSVQKLAGRLWMISGAKTGAESCESQLWVSDDGIVWTDVKALYSLPEFESTELAAFNNKIWAVGNQTDMDDVWSFDGENNWKSEVEDGSCEDDCFNRRDHYLLAHDQKLFMVSGLNQSSLLKDVWQTTDGMSWSKLSPEVSELFAINGAFSSFKGKMIFHGGISYSDYGSLEGRLPVNRLWSSENGLDWNKGYQHTLRFEK